MFPKNKRGYVIVVVMALCPSKMYGEGRTFSMPDSILLFGTYNDVRVVTPNQELGLRPPVHVKANLGEFHFPSIAPAGDLIAWGVAVGHDPDSHHPTRFKLAIYSVSEQKWATYGDFDDIGATAFSPDGSKIAFVAQERDGDALLVFDVRTQKIARATTPKGIWYQASLSWSPDGKKLAFQIQRSEERSTIAVLDLSSGQVQTLGDGYEPSWSPDGNWIAYYASSGQKCMLMHPDGTGTRAVKTLGGRLFGCRVFGWRVVWSPDGKQLLLNQMKGDGPDLDVILLNIDSGRSVVKKKNALPVFGWATERKSPYLSAK